MLLRAVCRVAESELGANIPASRPRSSNYAQVQSTGRRQPSEAGKTQEELAKVYPRLRFAGQVVFADARRL